MKMRIAGIRRHSSVNGPGVRYVLFFQGCSHACPGCQNPETHALDGGMVVDTATITADIATTKYIDGVTLSGGDPFAQTEALGEIARACKQTKRNLWVYTGFTYEEILLGMAGEAAIGILKDVDVLVDGRFIQALRDEKCRWRGSSNQRLIDVKASLREGKAILSKEEK